MIILNMNKYNCILFAVIFTFFSLKLNAQEHEAPLDTTDQKTIVVKDEKKYDRETTNTRFHKLPYSETRERVEYYRGKNIVKIDGDTKVCLADRMLDKSKKKCFIVVSKKDYYLYVYEAQGNDTVLLAKYDCAFGLRKGDKGKQGDMRTPHCKGLSNPNKLNLMTPFTISEICNSSSWRHDFRDGRGNILSYGAYFMRLRLSNHTMFSNRSIGIHGSTGNEETVPGRASEGCIRLKDVDIKELREKFCYLGMKVYIKAEEVDDLPFEIKAINKQNISRKRHLNPAKTLTNEKIIAVRAKE